MSLMNDALRKKRREDPGAAAAPVVAAVPVPHRSRKWPVVVLGTAVAVGAIVGGVVLWRSADVGSLQPGRSSMTRPETPAQATIARPALASLPAATAAAAHANVPAMAMADKVAVALPPEPSAAAVAEDDPHRQVPPSASTGQSPRSADGQMDAQPGRPPLEGSGRVPAEDQPATVSPIEPGPKRAATPSPLPRTAATVPAGRPEPAQSIPSPPASRPQVMPDADRFYQKALSRHRNGRLPEAERFYRNTLATDANHRPAMFNLAAIYIETGRFNEAAPLLKRLEKISPRPDGVLLNLAITSLGLNAPETALQYLDRAEAASEAPFWQIQFHRAVALARLDRLSEALNLYEQVETRQPDDYRVLFNLALTHDAMAHYTRAIHYYELLLKAPGHSSPDDRQAIQTRLKQLRRYRNPPPLQAKRQ